MNFRNISLDLLRYSDPNFGRMIDIKKRNTDEMYILEVTMCSPLNRPGQLPSGPSLPRPAHCPCCPPTTPPRPPSRRWRRRRRSRRNRPPRPRPTRPPCTTPTPRTNYRNGKIGTYNEENQIFHKKIIARLFT